MAQFKDVTCTHPKRLQGKNEKKKMRAHFLLAVLHYAWKVGEREELDIKEQDLLYLAYGTH